MSSSNPRCNQFTQKPTWLHGHTPSPLGSSPNPSLHEPSPGPSLHFTDSDQVQVFTYGLISSPSLHTPTHELTQSPNLDTPLHRLKLCPYLS